jgi:hypothetical protein
VNETICIPTWVALGVVPVLWFLSVWAVRSAALMRGRAEGRLAQLMKR